MGEGDIGTHFPPGDERWKGADSTKFVEYAAKLLKDKEGEFVNADITIICEEPKIGPYREEMRRKVAEIIETDITNINIKATTTEGLGFTGRKEGAAAQAIVSVRLSI